MGLVNVSGFHVDPGYKGRLKFAVYNAGGSDIKLTRGDAIFLIWFSELDKVSQHLYVSTLDSTSWTGPIALYGGIQRAVKLRCRFGIPHPTFRMRTAAPLIPTFPAMWGRFLR